MPKDVPPGSSSNPPKVKAALKRASKQINQIKDQLDELKKAIKEVDCGKSKKKR
jgi:archaellum component FlaC